VFGDEDEGFVLQASAMATTARGLAHATMRNLIPLLHQLRLLPRLMMLRIVDGMAVRGDDPLKIKWVEPGHRRPSR
jgi:hypothetical protein